MKKTPLKKIGKIGLRNLEANRILKEKFEELGIYWCEKCGRSDLPLTNAHRHKRDWYYPEERQHLLYDINQVLKLCLGCHIEIEGNVEKTDLLFNMLRP